MRCVCVCACVCVWWRRREGGCSHATNNARIAHSENHTRRPHTTDHTLQRHTPQPHATTTPRATPKHHPPWPGQKRASPPPHTPHAHATTTPHHAPRATRHATPQPHTTPRHTHAHATATPPTWSKASVATTTGGIWSSMLAGRGRGTRHPPPQPPNPAHGHTGVASQSTREEHRRHCELPPTNSPPSLPSPPAKASWQ